MKKAALSLIFSLFIIPLFAQQPELGLPGDNLNLYGVLNIFQNSPTLEEFEKRLNDPNTKVNNLDLNGDGQIDYLHVIDNVNGAIHDIVLRDDINENETQDVAVIEVERDANNHVHIQIIGDEALYGKDYIVEPQANTPNPGYHGNTVVNRPYYAPETWGIIGFMYAPSYVVYASPWHWGYYPHFWHPWVPVTYSVYYGYPHPYYTSYRRSYVYASPAAHAYYAPHRAVSPVVMRKYPPRPAPAPGNRTQPAPVNRGTQGNRPTEKIHPTPNNQTHQVNQTSHPVNNQTHQVNQTSHPVNNQTHQVNQTSHPVNNQTTHPVNTQTQKSNQITHQTNNQPQKMNQTSHPANNQSGKIHQTQHPATHQATHPANNQEKKEPEKK
jgi:uncharacterized protein YoxC